MLDITKIDCDLAGGTKSLGQNDLYTVFNPTLHPGCLAACFSKAAHQTMSGNIASRLALEHFVKAVSDALSKPSIEDSETRAVMAMEFAFREANQSVYDFGHQLAAGGRLGAALIGLIIQDNVVAVGKSDAGSVYIVRHGEVVPFFIDEGRDNSFAGNYVGAHSLVHVELSSLPLQSEDRLLAFSRTLETEEEAKLIDLLQAEYLPPNGGANSILEKIFSKDVEDLPVLMTVAIGPEGIYLQEVAA